MATAPISPKSPSICSVTDKREFQKRQYSKLQWIVCALAMLLLLVQIVAVAATTSLASSTITTSTSTTSSRISTFGTPKKGLAFDVARNIPRGGAGLFGTMASEDEDEEEIKDEEENNENDIRQHPEYDKLQAYRMKQQVLLQLRATFLSEALAKRGLPIPSLKDVSTPDGKVPPKKVDWDCAMSTEADPKHCLISYEPEPGSKLLVPTELASTDKWITLAALNRLRRDDPSKIEPMWSDRYAILSSWFGPKSRYSLLQHVGPKGVVLSTLLDGNRLPAVVGLLMLVLVVQLLPVIEILANRFLVSNFLWSRWISWYRYVHIGLPFKLLILQTVYSYVAKGFMALVSVIKDKLVDLECQILEETIPLTLGEGSEDAFGDAPTTEENEEEEEDSSWFEDEDDE